MKYPIQEGLPSAVPETIMLKHAIESRKEYNWVYKDSVSAMGKFPTCDNANQKPILLSTWRQTVWFIQWNDSDSKGMNTDKWVLPTKIQPTRPMKKI